MQQDVPNLFLLGPTELYVLCTHIVIVITLIFLFFSRWLLGLLIRTP